MSSCLFCFPKRRNSLRLLLLSDLHLEFGSSILNLPSASTFDVIILAGDIHTGENVLNFIRNELVILNKPIIFVAGNHEFYHHVIDDVILKFHLFQDNHPNFYFLNNSFTVIDDVRFVGSTLWSDFDNGSAESFSYCKDRMADFKVVKYISENGELEVLTPQKAFEFHKRSLEVFGKVLSTDFSGPNVVITHHLPTPKSSSEKWQGHPLNGAFQSSLIDFISKHKPSLWLHGHTHDPCDYVVGSTRIVAEPCGYPGERTIHSYSGKIVEIEM
ncbi:hypothetical protein RCL1_006219 [Eukaryota sp. TZLM3-RCL]